MKMDKMKILYIAYGCEPYAGSEQGVGWNWAVGLSKIADVTVLTRANNEKVINKWLEDNQSSIKFIYYDLKDWQKAFKKRDKGVYLYYFLWRFGAYKKCKKMNLSQYDLIWDTNFGNAFLPTYIYRHNKTSVSGPVGFGLGVKKDFAKRYGNIQRIKHAIKRTFFSSPSSIHFFAKKVLKSDKIICSAPWFYDLMDDETKKKSKLVLYNAIDIQEIDSMISDENLVDSDELNILCIGRMVANKEFEIALKAVISLKGKKDIKLNVIGWGEQEAKLKAMTKDNGAEDVVTFHQKISRQKVIAFLKQSDILIMPSTSEGLSSMAMEAMACKCLPLLMDIPAHTLLADETCSIKIKADTPEQAVEGFAQAILRCYNNRPLMEEMSENARKRAQQKFDWSCREKDLKEVLEFCLEKRN